MKINIFPIVSSLHSTNVISKNTLMLLEELKSLSNHEFNIVDIDSLYDADLSLILIQSGGSEQLILENIDKLKQPFYLLTYGNNNSLAASLEILSYLKDNNLDGEVLHGSNKYIIERINALINTQSKYNYGVIGKPSDWLIASDVSYNVAKRLHNINLIDIPIEKLVDYYNEINSFSLDNTHEFNFDNKELAKALKLDKALNKIVNEYNLNGLTIRCFALLDKIKTTSCLSFGLLNEKNIVATCEGDVASMISMHVINTLTNQCGFQANPSRINVDDNTIVLAHCTLPLSMCKSYKLNTHFESGIGVAIKGEIKEQEITIFKLARNLKDYYVSTGKIITNLNEDNLCRTQIVIKLDDDVKYFLNRPYGNHHIVVLGNHKDKIVQYMNNI